MSLRIAALWLALGLLPCPPSLAAPAQGRTFYVAGAGGVPLSVTDAGNAAGPGILFIHGIGQGQASFQPQFESSLARRFHLVSFDLRGHGGSGKPWRPEDYADPAIWAQDVQSVLAATKLRNPVIVAWSYGTAVAADWMRIVGTDQLSGLVLVSALGGLVPQAPPSAPSSAAFLARLNTAHELQASARVEDQITSARIVGAMLTAGHTSAQWNATSLHLATLVPGYAQGPLRAHRADNHDLAARLRVPVLVIYGAHDGSVAPAALAQLLREVPSARASRFETSGHSPFAEDTTRFNAELERFMMQLAGTTTAVPDARTKE